MNKTKIETAEYTWNPVTGCDKICFNGDCYAYQMMQRFGKSWGYDWVPRLHKERLNEPLLEKIPRCVPKRKPRPTSSRQRGHATNLSNIQRKQGDAKDG